MRQKAGRSVIECAKLLGISARKYEQYEKGETFPSMPEIEVLAHYWQINPLTLWESADESKKAKILNSEQYQQIIQIRQRILGTYFRLHRSKKGFSLKQMSEMTGLSSGLIKRYESGLKPIPITDLVLINRHLEIELEGLLDQDGQLFEARRDSSRISHFLALAEELQEFVIQPENNEYLRLAMDIKKNGIENLRKLAESILEMVRPSGE
jgi:transcriptional regulator with XRE-family HTH domain